MRAHRTHAMLITSKTTDLAHLAAEHCTRAPYTLPCGLYRCDPDAFGSVESGALEKEEIQFHSTIPFELLQRKPSQCQYSLIKVLHVV